MMKFLLPLAGASCLFLGLPAQANPNAPIPLSSDESGVADGPAVFVPPMAVRV